MRLVSADVVNEEYEPTENDEQVLKAMKRGRESGKPWGRANPRWLIDETGLEKGNVEFCLRQLTSAGWVRRVARGCYEFVADPRERPRDVSGTPTPKSESGASAPLQQGRGDSDDTDGAESRSLREEMEAALDGLDVPGRRPEVEYKRREAIKWAWAFICDADGTVTTREVANSVFAEFFEERIGYTTNARYAGYGLWDGCVRDALKELPGIAPPGPRGNQWRFDEDANRAG